MANAHLHNFQRAKRCSFPSARQRRVINFIFNIFALRRSRSRRELSLAYRGTKKLHSTGERGDQTNGNYFTTRRAVRQGISPFRAHARAARLIGSRKSARHTTPARRGD